MQAEKPAMFAASPSRVAGLDGLRGIAAAAVALYHVQILHPGGLQGSIGGLGDWLFEWGWTFVDLFFVVSGYIFAHVYLSTREFKAADLSNFALARIARLYPLHLTLLLIVAVIDWGRPQNTVEAFAAHLFMLQGLVPHAQEGFVGPSWSISIEMVCYFIFALAACSGGKTLTRISALLVTLSLAHFALSPASAYRPDDLVRGLLGFFTGQLLWRYRDILVRLPTWMLLLAFGAGVSLPTGTLNPLVPLGVLAWPAALLLAMRLRLFATAPLLWLGDRSYAIYLVHYPVLSLVQRFTAPSRMADLAAVGLVLVLADVALRTVERPGRRAIQETWRRRRSAEPVALPLGPKLD